MTRPLRALLLGAGTAAGYALGRRWSLGWGATTSERVLGLAGDELLPDAGVVATRAVTVHAPADAVWPWLVQLGQGRGGFYSYDALQRLLGLGIRNADAVDPRWQGLAPGDEVRLAPQVPLVVARLEPPQALVLRDGPGADATPARFVWAFVLRPGPLPGTCRLVVRERYAAPLPWVRGAVEVLSWPSLVMTRRMLRGVRERAEGARAA